MLQLPVCAAVEGQLIAAFLIPLDELEHIGGEMGISAVETVEELRQVVCASPKTAQHAGPAKSAAARVNQLQ